MSDTIIQPGRPEGVPLGLSRKARVDAFQRVAANMNEANNLRLDATSVVFLARQLEDLDAQLYETLFPSAMAARLVPQKTDIDPGAETHTYQYGDISGAPRLLAAAAPATDLPEFTVTGGSETVNLYSWGGSYSYSIQELRRAAMASLPLDVQKAQAARKIMGLHFESVMCTGNSTLSLKGFANNANVSLVTPTTGTWSSATALQMIADMSKAIRAVKVDSKGAHVANLVALPPSLMALLEITLVANTAVTAIEHLRKTYPAIDFQEWALLETAGASSVARIVVAERDSMNYQGLAPVEFESFAPQLHGMRYVVPVHQRLGGVLVRYPLAMRYMDGC